MTITRVPLKRCTVKDCPAKRTDEEWHTPWCGHGLPWTGTHCHWPKKGMGGNNPESKIVAYLCWPCHDRADNADWGMAVVGGVFRLWDIHNETLLERVISDGVARTWLGGDLRSLDSGRHSEGRGLAASGERHTGDALDLGGGSGGTRTLKRVIGNGNQEASVAVVARVAGSAKGRLLDAPRRVLEPVAPNGRMAELKWCEETMQLLYQWQRVKAVANEINWVIGDKAIEAEKLFAHEAYQYLDTIEQFIGRERFRQCIWVAERIPECYRVPTVSWSHHRAVAGLLESPQERQEAILRAEAEGWTERELHAVYTADETRERCVCICGNEHWRKT